MKKFKIGISFVLLVLLCIFTQSFLLFVNYLLAIFLHELAHLFVATRRGYKLKQIKLDMFGLSLSLDNDIEDKDSFAINIAGPMFNLLLVVVCLACYFLFPSAILYLNSFCMCNLVLAVFNMLPIYPLDGGKVVSAIIGKDKVYKKVDLCFRIAFCVIFIILFIYSTTTIINWWWLLVAVFFLTSKGKKKTNLSLFKYTKNKHIERVVMYKLTGQENLYDILKKVSSNKYTIFYYRYGKNYYIDEDKIIDIATKIPLTTQISEVVSTCIDLFP